MSRNPYILLIISLFASCVSNNSPKADGTYFGGEIINPIRNYITITKDLAIIDTVQLDRRNRFMYQFKDFSEGLYQFNHGEVQIFHIEEGDSLMARVNTKEFDESLYYSGYGSERSNFLIEMFLLWENESDNFNPNYQKSPENFKKVIDSLNAVRKSKVDKLLAKKEYSEDFQEIALAATYYDNYQRLETYPFPHYTKNRIAFIRALPESFYRFRDSINLNNENLRDLFPYQRYVNAYLDQQAFINYGSKKSYDRLSYTHNINKIQLIDSLIKEPIQRDRLLNRIAREFIANSNNTQEVNEVFDMIMSSASLAETREIVTTLHNNHKSMEAGNRIPDVTLVDTTGKPTSLISHIKRPTVIFFWSDRSKGRMFNSHSKVADLKSKYPEFDFIGITVNDDHKRWVKTIASNKYKSDVEYRFSQPNEGRKSLVVNDLNKTIVVNSDGTILNSHANLHNSNFENDLLAYLNQ